MQLTFDQIRAITVGAVDFEETKDSLQPYRLTAAQREFTSYEERYYNRGMAAAGICFCFETDSLSLSLEMECLDTAVRDYFSFEVFADDRLVDYLDNFPEEGLPSQFYHLTELARPEGIFSKTFDLGEGQKTVRVNFPWSKIVRIRSVSLDDGAFVVPVKKIRSCWPLVIPLPMAWMPTGPLSGISPSWRIFWGRTSTTKPSPVKPTARDWRPAGMILPRTTLPLPTAPTTGA